MKFLKVLLALGVIMFIFNCSDDDSLIEDSAMETEERQDEIPGFNFPTPCEAHNITYFINENCDGTVYEDAIVNAIQQYNDAPIGLFFTEVGTAAGADIVLDCVDGDNCGEGVAFFPGGDLSIPNANIDLEILWENCLCTDDPSNCNFVGEEPACMFTRTVLHELAHAIGIHHNGEGIWIPGTPNTGNDPNSVFNSGPITNLTNCDWCDSPCEFNNGDLAALQILYPEVTISGWECPTVGMTSRYCLTGLRGSDATVTWSGGSIAKGQFCRDFTFNEPGTYEITAEICEGDCCFTVTKTVTVDDEIKCYCVCVKHKNNMVTHLPNYGQSKWTAVTIDHVQNLFLVGGLNT